MADVQLEHGFLRLANALDEAITYADFSATHQKVVRCLVRVTYGWRRYSVRMTHAELADRCGLKVTGGFRKALDELIDASVVRVLQPPVGRTPGAYMLNKNFEEWGRYSVAAKRLESLFGERLPDADYLIRGASPRAGEGDQTKPPPTAPIKAGDLDEAGAPSGSDERPVQGMKPPVRGTQAPSNPPSDNELEAWKDSTTQERKATNTGEGSGEGSDSEQDATQEYAIKLVSAANNAAAERWGELARARPLHWHTATQLAIELQAREVPIDLARKAIVECVKVKPAGSQPPRHINYFTNAIDDAAKAVEQRRLDADNPIPKLKAPRGAQPLGAIVKHVVDPDAQRREAAQLAAFNEALNDAGVQWGNNPDNKTEYDKIVAQANADFRERLGTPMGDKMRNGSIVAACARASGFPRSFDVWIAGQRAPSAPTNTGAPTL